MSDQGTVERAFALAASGDCASVEDIRTRLKREGFTQIGGHLSGLAIRRQLRAICDSAKGLPR
jgi:hypothetical protein